MATAASQVAVAILSHQRDQRQASVRRTSSAVAQSTYSRNTSNVVIDDLPSYSENIEYEEHLLPQDIARKAVKNHEKKVKCDLKAAQNADIQREKIKRILPRIYDQLNFAIANPKAPKERTGPAAYRQETDPDTGVEITFHCKGITQKALRLYLPALLAEYQRERHLQDIADHQAHEEAQSSPGLLRRATTEQSHNPVATSGDETLTPQMTARQDVFSSVAGPGVYDAGRMSVSAAFFEDYTQKIYFSRKFLALWKKKESGKRENIASAIAMILVGLKLGLPFFDLMTFVAIDCPRLALQGITGRQKLKLQR